MNDGENNYDNPRSWVSEAAKETGRDEAVSTIYTQGMAVRDAAHSGAATEATWQARGALQIWRAAYAAAYREMLVIKDQLEAYAQGAGIPDTIFEHPKERAAHLELIEHEGEMREGAGTATGEEARDDEVWPF